MKNHTMRTKGKLDRKSWLLLLVAYTLAIIAVALVALSPSREVNADYEFVFVAGWMENADTALFTFSAQASTTKNNVMQLFGSDGSTSVAVDLRG